MTVLIKWIIAENTFFLLLQSRLHYCTLLMQLNMPLDIELPHVLKLVHQAPSRVQTSQTPPYRRPSKSSTLAFVLPRLVTHPTQLPETMFRVELLANSSSHATPGYTYVADRGFDPAKAAMAPALGRKRGIHNAGKGGDISSRRANAIIRHLAELDRENQRDVQIPVPARPAKEAGARVSRTKTTSNVRRILVSQKTFRNHLDDEEAAIAAGGGGLSIPVGAAAAAPVIPSRAKAVVAAAAASRRSSTPASTAAARKKRPSTVAAATATSTPTPALSQPETTDAEVEDDTAEPKHKLIKTEHDNDPLLRSYAPTMPSERIMDRLLAEPALSYNASRAGPPISTQLPRAFCCMCGYWGKIRCKSCHLRTCGLDCYKVHEDSRCGAFF
jgi:zinc finger HIT domain-containing protein 1